MARRGSLRAPLCQPAPNPRLHPRSIGTPASPVFQRSAELERVQHRDPVAALEDDKEVVDAGGLLDRLLLGAEDVPVAGAGGGDRAQEGAGGAAGAQLDLLALGAGG